MGGNCRKGVFGFHSDDEAKVSIFLPIRQQSAGFHVSFQAGVRDVASLTTHLYNEWNLARQMKQLPLGWPTCNYSTVWDRFNHKSSMNLTRRGRFRPCLYKFTTMRDEPVYKTKVRFSTFVNCPIHYSHKHTASWKVANHWSFANVGWSHADRVQLVHVQDWLIPNERILTIFLEDLVLINIK